MRVFLTGATGFVGSAVAQSLIKAGHQVTGLARSEANAQALIKAGVKVHQGSLEDLESLRSGASASDGVIHTGFVHDFSRMKEVCEIDNRAIETLGSALANSDRPLIVTSGTALIKPGHLITEENPAPPVSPSWPRASEESGNACLSKGVKASAVRLSPSVHGEGDHGFIPILIGVAREKGVSAYVGEGKNRWPAVHRLDAGELYRLAFEKSTAGARYHGVADEGIEFKKIAEIIGKRLGLPVVSKTPEEAAAHFGWFTNFAAIDAPASNKLTRERLGWIPTHAGLLEDLDHDRYFKK